MKNNITKYTLCSLSLCAGLVSAQEAGTVIKGELYKMGWNENNKEIWKSPAGDRVFLPKVATAPMVSLSSYDVQGVILNEKNEPVADAIVKAPGKGVIRTDANGCFTLEGIDSWTPVVVTADGYYQKEVRCTQSSTPIRVYLTDLNTPRYNETLVTGHEVNEQHTVATGAVNVNKKDFSLNAMSLERALQGEMTGLQVIQKSGMTGEGAYLAFRGIRSLVAENAPLIVINGVPFMPDRNESALISGYSRSIFQAINPQDISNVTLVKGAAAALYGSLGSNGVLFIETDGAKSDDLNTKISFTGSCGMNWQDRSLPLMNAAQYKGYLTDMGMNYYNNDMGAFFKDFAFLTNPSANNAHLYGFDTDWQDVIYSNSMSNDYLFRVEGGDAIAKYDISLGYTGDQGTLKDTKSDRYSAQINANVLVSKKFTITAGINLAYLNGQYQEQGYNIKTNPLLAAYRRSPLLSPYKSSTIPSEDGSYGLLRTPSSYFYGGSTNTDFIVSNPLAIVNTIDGTIRQYDMNAKVQLTYKPTIHWDINGIVGIYTNFDKEKIFIPGIDNAAIVPLFDQYGEAKNTVRVGEGFTFNMYYGASANYQKRFNNRHAMNVKAGMNIVTTSNEYDLANGRNTANDFYQTMGDTQSIGHYFEGYNNAWNWLNGYIQADYTYSNWATAGIIASVDGASSTGKDADRAHFYPAAHATLMAANLPALAGANWLNKLDVYADYSVTGNSQYSSKYGKYYYTSKPYQSIAGIVRANVPNTKLNIEKDKTLNAGIDMTVWRNRLNVKAGYYNTKSDDVLMLSDNSSALGTSPYYCNAASLENQGFEVSAQVIPVWTKNFRWVVGGNLTTLNNTVKSLGGSKEYITKLTDGAEILTRIDENPYSFYGYQTTGVYATTADAENANLRNRNGVAYQAGDVIFKDMNNDGIINDMDKVVLGSATPDFYGSFYTSIEYKGWALDLNFVYSVGNDAYNAMRRVTESSSDFSNQSTSVLRRWQNEGDITKMPRASWGDVVGNNDFSDRFVEDASYLKLRDITLSYNFNKKIWNFIQSGTIYVSGQNLICLTDYLGMDPEYAYSYNPSLLGVDYGKVALPKSVKFGVNLKF